MSVKDIFLPKRSPEFNPDEQVWNEIKKNRIGIQLVKNKVDLKDRLVFTLDSLKQNTKRIISFLPMSQILAMLQVVSLNQFRALYV